MATVKLGRSNSSARSLDYADKRAVEKNGLNCDTEKVKDTKFEMKQVQEIYQKTDKTQAHTVIQSFSPEESKKLTPQQVNQMGMELAQEIAPTHQVAVYTHVDKEHLHNHIIINAIDLETGKKYHHHNDFERVKTVNDNICKAHHLEIIQPRKQHEKRTSSEIQMNRRGKTPWKDEVRRKIDSVMSDSSISSYKAFREHLEEKGVIVHDRGKNVTYELLEGNKKVRGSKLGSSYEKNTLKQEFNVRQKRATYRKTIANKSRQKRRIVSSKNRYEYNLARFKKSLCVDFEEKLTERKGLIPQMSKDYFKKKKFKANKPLKIISPVKFQRVIPKTIEPTRSLGNSLSL